MTRESQVKIVKLFSACGPDREGDTQVVARFAGPHFKGSRIEVGVELLGNVAHGFCKTVHPCAHDLTGKSQGYSISDSLWAALERGGCAEALIKSGWLKCQGRSSLVNAK